MKVADSLEQLARYNVQKKQPLGRVDPGAEKRKRFNTILEMFAGDDNPRDNARDLAALSLMSPGAQSSLYGRMLQVLGLQAVQRPGHRPETIRFTDLPNENPQTVKTPGPSVRSTREPVTPAGEQAQINRSVARVAEKYNLPEELIKGVIKAESAYNPRAVSPAGAQGLMQLMPETARALGVTDAFDIEQNIDAGARYLRRMLDRYDGDLSRALAAYNAGPGTVDRFNGKVPYPETLAYVDRVLRYSQRA